MRHLLDPLYLSAGAASIALFVLFRSVSAALVSLEPHEKTIPSPRRSVLSTLSRPQVHELPYPPDVLPGARDVETPYGSIRVYEWGPEEGRKVLFVHGMSTPCISLGPLAEKLAQNGCRVMLFDLFGRGYSDGVSELPYDNRLYTSQILLVLSSSAISWLNPQEPIALIGYSLGGGLIADFTSYFPHLVSSLVLIAPGGLLRTEHNSWKSKFLYSNGFGLLPRSFIHWLLARNLRSGPRSFTSKEHGAGSAAHAEGGALQLKKPDNDNGDVNYKAIGRRSSESIPQPVGSIFPSRPNVTVDGAVDWQIDHHPGFVPAFMSSFRSAPIYNQHHRWCLIGKRLSHQKANPADSEEALRQSLGRSKVLIVLGTTDPIIIEDEIRKDAEETLGQSNVEIVALETGHEVPMSKSAEVAEHILRFWGEDLTH